MTTTTTEVYDALVAAGVNENAATEIAQRLQRRAGPSALPILVGATLAGFTLLGIGLGWVKNDVAHVRTELSQVRAELKTEIVANRTQLSGVSERLTRIETLLEERLPDRP